MNHSIGFRPTECRVWFDMKGYGFLHNPDLDDLRDVFCHVSKLPVRDKTYPRLQTGERVEIRFSSNRKGKLQVDELRFPEGGPTP